MLSREIFTMEYIRELQKQYKKDPGLLERVMYAFGLLEALTQVGMKFVFKGGTSLLLLTEHPLGVKKELEIMKQLYDITTLSEIFSNQQELWETYDRVVEEEIAFRDIGEDRDSVLQDTIHTAACIIGRGYIDPEEYSMYVDGANALDSHILLGKYNGEMAAIDACQVMYLAACVLKRKSFEKIKNPEKYIAETMTKSKYKKLSYIKKHKLDAYGYLVEAVRLLGTVTK